MEQLPSCAETPERVLVYGSLHSTCTICNATSSPNPQLCYDCQPWNDAKHVFQCMQPISFINHYPNIAPKSVIFSILEKRNSCLVCSAISTSIKDLANASRLDVEKLRILNGGPYLLPYHKESWSNQNEQFFPDDELKWTMISTDHVLQQQVCGANGASTALWHMECIIPLWIGEIEKFEKVETPGLHDQNWPDNVFAPRFRLTYENPLSHLLSVSPSEAPFIRLDMIKTWIDECRQNHQACHETSKALPSGARVVDVRTMNIVALQDKRQYTALSYTWCGTDDMLQLESGNFVELEEEGALSHCNLAKVLKEAMQLCNSLGYRYLWVDRLCIIQDEPISKMRQIEAMDSIYSNASLTIVVATESGGRSGVPGVPTNPRRHSALNTHHYFHVEHRAAIDNFPRTISNSYWNSRGWTFQERLLSHRLLYITDDDVYFECSEKVFQESCGYSQYTRDYDGRYSLPSVLSISSPVEYTACVEQYSARQLTHPSDVLAALQGICNLLVDRLNSKFDYGLPRRCLPTSLCWLLASDVMARRAGTENIPSWSWAAWTGKITYERTREPLNVLEWGTLVRFYRVEDGTTLTKLEVDEAWFNAITDFEELQLMDEIPQVKSRRNPKRNPPQHLNAVWRDCPQNPWTTFSQSTLTSQSIDVNRIPPWALVFRTMSARLRLSDEAHSLYPADSRVTIHNAEGDPVGHLEGIRSCWIGQSIDTNVSHEFVVICAGFSRWDPLLARWAQNEGSPASAVWEMRVMLVERDPTNNRLCRRVAIGTIRTLHWKKCNPSWKLVILV